jgi:hypothetical protein
VVGHLFFPKNLAFEHHAKVQLLFADIHSDEIKIVHCFCFNECPCAYLKIAINALLCVNYVTYDEIHITS